MFGLNFIYLLILSSVFLIVQTQFQTILVQLNLKSNETKHTINFSYLFNNTDLLFASDDLFEHVSLYCIKNELSFETCIKLIAQASLTYLSYHNYEHFFDTEHKLLKGQSIEAKLAQTVSSFRPKLASKYALSLSAGTGLWELENTTDDDSDKTYSEAVYDEHIWNITQSTLRHHTSSISSREAVFSRSSVYRVCFIHSCAL